VGNERIFLSEEQREHMHVIGTTGEGKSYFLLQLMMGDVERGNGLCFLDPSDNADTMYKFLRYLAKRNFKKVIVIDPLHLEIFGKITPINPFLHNKQTAVANVLDTLRVLYQQRDWAQTPIIRRYLKAIVSLLWEANRPLTDSLYFTEAAYIKQRMEILDQTDFNNRQRLMIEAAWKHQRLFVEYQSTVRRLEELFHPKLQEIFNKDVGINFNQLIADGWVILVNLYAAYGLEAIHTRLLGTMVINEIISAVDSLKKPRLKEDGTLKDPWQGRYYLYLDEAGQYANEKLLELMAYKGKSGLRVTIAHQFFSQFPDRDILEGVKSLTKIKVAFNQPNPQDRLEIVREMYGGKLKDQDVLYSLAGLRKQHAVVKVGKEEPHIIRIEDIKIPEVDLGKYLQALYQDPLYAESKTVYYETKLTPEDTEQQINEDRRKDTPSPKPPSKANRRATGKGGVRQPKDTPESWESVSEQFEQRPRPPKTDGQQ
jgi:hypothetical protein